MLREHGAIIIDGIQTDSTLRCKHCGGHFRVVKSGYLPFCNPCGGYTCGRLSCLECVPCEARLEHAEGKKTKYDDLIKDLRL